MPDGESAPAQGKSARHHGAICVVARLEAARGAEGNLERALAAFAAIVRAEEPACTSYYVTRHAGAPEHFAVHARFADWAAFKAHAETPHMQRALPRISAALAAAVALEIFFEV